eukprot:3785590-Pleurochrysis_carterae.AAC.1
MPWASCLARIRKGCAVQLARKRGRGNKPDRVGRVRRLSARERVRGRVRVRVCVGGERALARARAWARARAPPADVSAPLRVDDGAQDFLFRDVLPQREH